MNFACLSLSSSHHLALTTSIQHHNITSNTTSVEPACILIDTKQGISSSYLLKFHYIPSCLHLPVFILSVVIKMRPLLQTVFTIFLILVAIFIFNIVTFKSLQCEIDTQEQDDHIHFPSSATSTEFANRLSQVSIHLSLCFYLYSILLSGSYHIFLLLNLPPATCNT